MGLFKKILHAGEGRKLKSLESIVPESSAPSSPRWSAAPTTSCAPSPPRSASELDHAGDDDETQRPPRRPAPRGVRRGPRGRRAHARPAPLRRPDHGRRGAALRLGRRDEDRRGQDARRHASRVPQRARRRRRPPRHRERLPRQARRRVDGADLPRSSASRSASSCPRSTTPRPSAAAYAADITYGTNNEFGFDYLRDNMAVAREDQVAARPLLRDRRRGRLDPHRRGPHAADHLGSRRRRAGALLPVRRAS